MAELKKKQDELLTTHDVVTMEVSAAALAPKFEQILWLSRRKLQYAQASSVLQAEYYLHLSYEEFRNEETVRLNVPVGITPAELNIFYVAATKIIENKDHSRQRREVITLYRDSIGELMKRPTDDSPTAEDAGIALIVHSLEALRKA